MGTAMRQCGHSKSANSTTVTFASSGPFEGEPAVGMTFAPCGSKRALNASWICVCDAPSRTAWAMDLAAGRHAAQGRVSPALGDQPQSDGGAPAASRSLTSELNSLRSRGVIALVSTPWSVTSLTSACVAEDEDCGSGMLALESRQLDQPPTATPSARKAASWTAFRKAPLV